MYPQQPSTPSTVRSVSKEQSDTNTANMAMTPSCQGMLTDEQEKSRDLNRALFGDNYLISKQQTQIRSASTATTNQRMNFSGHVAMVATVVQDKAKSSCSSTLLAQTGG